MKKCFKCLIEKPLTEFYKHKEMADGHLNKCKECSKAASKKQVRDPEAERKRNALPGRVAARAAYAKTSAGMVAHNRGSAAYVKRNPKKKAAATMVGNAIRDKKLFKEPCEVCGTNETIHAHHDDYDKPLNVRWLCSLHHRAWHKLNGEGANPI